MNNCIKGDREICLSFAEENAFGAVTPPIVQTSLFAFDDYDQFNAYRKKELKRYCYTRGLNPTVEVFEKKIAALEGAENAKAFASGMSAIAATLFSLLGKDKHLVFMGNIYGPALEFAEILKKDYGVKVTTVFSGDLQELKELADKSLHIDVIYMESPGTMTMKMLDIEGIATFAKKCSAITALDNTWATPLFQKPLQWGIDLSIHSCTKYIGGHSDVLAGIVAGKAKYIEQIFNTGFKLLGGSISPLEAWLLVRGLRTLPLRMHYLNDTVQKVLNFLQEHSAVEKVYHPAVAEKQEKIWAEKYLKGYAGLLSFELKNKDIDSLKIFANALRIFKNGVSWGGHESLICIPYTGENEKILSSCDLPPKIIRLSIGLEDIELLLADLEQALKKVS